VKILNAMSIHTLAAAVALAVAATVAGQDRAGGELVKFSENYAEGVLYAIVDRHTWPSMPGGRP
jgi:hypothetical protein